jgi:hypothetical protein
MECGLAAAQRAGVLDVVVNEERVVEHLERDRRRQRLVDIATECDRGRQTERRADRLAATPRIFIDQIPEVTARFGVGEVETHRLTRDRAVAGQILLDRGGLHRAHSITSSRIGSATSGSPLARTWPW